MRASCRWPLRYVILGFKIYQDVKKSLRGHRAILSYIGLKFPQIKSRKDNFLLYRIVKVIDLSNHKLRILNCQLNLWGAKALFNTKFKSNTKLKKIMQS